MPTNEQYEQWIQRGEPAKKFHPNVIVYSEMAVRAAIVRALKSAQQINEAKLLTKEPPTANGVNV